MMRTAAWAAFVWLAAAGAAQAAPKAQVTQRQIGLVPLKMVSVPTGAAEQLANNQAKVTLGALPGVQVVDVKLAPGQDADDARALQTAARGAMVDRIVGGELNYIGDVGTLKLVAVDPAGGKPLVVERIVDSASPEEIISAVEAASCTAAGDASGADGCQGNLALAGEVGDADLVVDGQVVASAPFIADVPVPLGPHHIQLRAGTMVSQQRKLYVHQGDTVKLRVATQCGTVFILDESETPGCGANQPQLSEVIEKTVIKYVPDPDAVHIKWSAVTTTAVGVALVVGGIFFGSRASARASDLNTSYHQNSGLGPNDFQTQKDVRSAATTANALYGAGGALTAAGVTLFFIPAIKF